MAWEPDRRSNSFFSPPAHLCAVTYMTEISLIVTLNNKFTHSLKGPWKVAVCVHPKHFQTLTIERHMRLQQLLGHPKVVALGEIGMDLTIPMAKWSRQDEVFKRMLQIAKIDQPLVIHLRGTKGDESGIDIHGRCLMMMEVVCNRQQKIHVHCFKGSVEVVKAWLRKFPNVYFGVTAAVRCFDRDQRAGFAGHP